MFSLLLLLMIVYLASKCKREIQKKTYLANLLRSVRTNIKLVWKKEKQMSAFFNENKTTISIITNIDKKKIER